MPEKALYNSRIIATYLKLIRKEYSQVDINELLAHAGMEPYQVDDEDHWFTQSQVNLFYERLEQMTGNKRIAREAGRFGASADAIGGIRHYILGLISPDNAYTLVGKYATSFTRSTSYISEKVGPNKISITVRPKDNVKEQPFQCENRIGYFEAVAALFGHRQPAIEHTECLFSGDPVCRYLITLSASHTSISKKLRHCSAIALIFLLAFALYNSSHPILIGICAGLLGVIIYANYVEKKELRAALSNLRSSSEKLIERSNASNNNLLVTNELSSLLSQKMDLNSVLSTVMKLIEDRLDYDRGIILLANEDKTRLYFNHGFGYTEKQLDSLKSETFRLDNPDSKGLFVLCFREQRPFLINDINEITGNLSAHSLKFVKQMGALSFICCPIIHENECLGILAVDNIRTKRPLLQRDINLLMGIAPAVGNSIHLAKLSEAEARQFQSVLKVLAASIDARDELTSGHSEIVTEYALGICTEMGLPPDYREMLRVASLLHDYGKIGVPDFILKKQGRLTENERKEIEKHVVKTKEILDQVSFAGIYKEVPMIAAAHHEKMDGSGYPAGLKGEQIPMGARIIAVADFFEAITSKRHYREPMNEAKALKLLMEGRGGHFDARVVDAFIRYFTRTLDYNSEKRAVEIKARPASIADDLKQKGTLF